MTLRPIALRAMAASVALTIGCARSAPTANPDDSTAVEPQVVLRDAIPGTLSGDAYEIAAPPRITADTLIVPVRYGGGCARHNFALHAERGFMESFPVQVLIVIRHSANGDRCKALLTRDLRFDLTPLRVAYTQAYQQARGVIVLRLRGYPEGVRYAFGG